MFISPSLPSWQFIRVDLKHQQVFPLLQDKTEPLIDLWCEARKKLVTVGHLRNGFFPFRYESLFP